MTLAFSFHGPHVADMGALEDVVKEALRLSPHSVRTIADEAGVSEKLLRMIRDGERKATVPVVTALADAMERLAEEQAGAASMLSQALFWRKEDA